ncbi:electron transport complex subunit E [Enterococcus pseudoavium]|uniref:Ion-translocating oxidoreductase complex subunit E n=1 Tax=Enterococcus pseudoavium TaxID=44007 RepID=A0AAE4I0Y9_9ENTE|nr:electron transport complex subunit E [Enterococcus pseudoavium]MDT2737151.1 electron transport complex subunit E [Enterococcus pseudoavium]REC32156.1 electron transport complex subunit RsxE [Enterococcus pseudoavium]
MEKEKASAIFTKGILTENPVLRLMLGTCPTLAVTTSAINGLGMGIAATVVLLGSNVMISLLRKVIPDRVRIPAYITIIAGFVTVVQLIVKALAPALDATLGIYLPLIVVNCIILGRAEAYAKNHSVFHSALDGLGMGVGFTATLLCMGGIRELLGSGTFLGFPITAGVVPPMTIMLLPPGGFFVFGMLVMAANKLSDRKTGELDCTACPIAEACTVVCDEKAGER